MQSEILWQHLDSPGWEHVRIISDHPGWTVFDSIFAREHNGEVLRGGFTLVTDKQWNTLELRLMVETSPGTMEGVQFMTEGDGRWTDANEEHIPELDGILDVAIPWTPLTNSLPINRLPMEVGEVHDIPVLQISLPDLVLQKATHRYTRVSGEEILFQDGTGKDSQIQIDSEGIVVTRDQEFQRTWPN